MNKTLDKILLITAVIILTATQIVPPSFSQDMNQPVVQTQQASSARAGQITQEEKGKISLDLKGMDVIEVLKMLATKGGLNLVIGNDVKGRVTIFLKSVDIMDALDIILVANDLAYDRRGEIIYIMSQKDYEALYGEKYSDKKEVRIFHLKYAKAAEVSKALNQIKTKIGKVVVDEGSNSVVVIESPIVMRNMADTVTSVDLPTKTKIISIKYAKVADLKTKVQESLTKGVGTMQIDERTNKIAVTDLESRMDDLSAMIEAFDSKPLQVLIEAKIVEVTLDDQFKMGIDWEAVLKNVNQNVNIQNAFQIASTGFVPGAQVLIGTLGANEDFAAMIQILKTVGDANLLSSPRITAVNNQEAKILVGSSQPYATSAVTQGTSTSTTATNLTFLDVGVKLYVTPTINDDDIVTMKIKPEVSSKSGDYIYYVSGGSSTTSAYSNKVPVISTTQAETVVTVRDGTTIIIGGLIKDERSTTVAKVPVLGDIPMLGMMFKRTENEIKKQELVIFLTPHIMSGETDVIKQPQTEPIGERKFTIPEVPTFERRNAIEMKPGIFKEKKPHSLARDNAAAIGAPIKITGKTTPDEYYGAVRQMIINAIELPKDRKNPIGKAHVKVGFVLMPNGRLASSPDVIQSSGHIGFDQAVVNAVVKADPFPAFPQSVGRSEKNLSIDISTEE